MQWEIIFDEDFETEFFKLPYEVRRETYAIGNLLKEDGPLLGRPRVDTLSGSRHANMKEMRFDADGGVWRVAFAFDPKRRAIHSARSRRQIRKQRTPLLYRVDPQSR